MVTDMTSQVPLKYSPTIELQGDISLPTPLNIFLCNLPSFHKQYSNENPFRASLIIKTARVIFTNKVTLWVANYSACVVYTKTIIIHLSVGESGGYLPHRVAARQVSTYTSVNNC